MSASVPFDRAGAGKPLDGVPGGLGAGLRFAADNKLGVAIGGLSTLVVSALCDPAVQKALADTCRDPKVRESWRKTGVVLKQSWQENGGTSALLGWGKKAFFRGE